MGKPIANLRLFIGAYPPPDVAEAMLVAQRSLTLPPHRITPADQVHLTIQFVGDTPVKALDDTVESVERAASGLRPFELAPLRLITLPRRGRPRLVALETDAPPDLLELQRRLAHRLARNARSRPGDRFLPHFTLSRFRHGHHPRDIEQAVDMAPFSISEVRLMKSVLLPSGPRHELVHAVPLA